MVLTRQHGDTDGATLPERLDGGMLGHAGVHPLIRWAHLHQWQLRRRQDPITPLNERGKKNQTTAVGDKNEIQTQKPAWLFATENCQNFFNCQPSSGVVRSEGPTALHGSAAKVSPLTYMTHRSTGSFTVDWKCGNNVCSSWCQNSS